MSRIATIKFTVDTKSLDALKPQMKEISGQIVTISPILEPKRLAAHKTAVDELHATLKKTASVNDSDAEREQHFLRRYKRPLAGVLGFAYGIASQKEGDIFGSGPGVRHGQQWGKGASLGRLGQCSVDQH